MASTITCYGFYGQLLQSLQLAATVCTVSMASLLRLIKAGLDRGGFISTSAFGGSTSAMPAKKEQPRFWGDRTH